ncbi:MAG: S-layer homology domain-containing protein [Actinomycetia bacterium]|nr:S-layer homology domain-containing protein [Actinomycetes bacterium]
MTHRARPILVALAFVLGMTPVHAEQPLPGQKSGGSEVEVTSPQQHGSDLFDDVPNGHWADEEIGWAVRTGVMAGIDNGMFGLNAPVSRQEIVTFLFRVNALLGGSGNEKSVNGSEHFDDVPPGHEAGPHFDLLG